MDLQSAMLSRRTLLLTPLAIMAATRAVSAAGKMTLAIHQNTSAAAGYRKSLEGWAKAGVKNVELTNTLLDEFLKSDSLPAAKRVLTDLGLTPVSSACGVFGLWEPNPKRAAQVEAFKKEMQAAGARFEVVTYPGAKHGFTNPEAGTYGLPALAYDATADRESWAAMLKMFREVFP